MQLTKRRAVKARTRGRLRDHEVLSTIRDVLSNTYLKEGKDYFVGENIPGESRRGDIFFPVPRIVCIFDQFAVERGWDMESRGWKVITLVDSSERYIKSVVYRIIRKFHKDFRTWNPKDRWQEIVDEWGECSECGLCKDRQNLVLGEFSEKFDSCEVMIVGEGPGPDEDEQGRPFVGKSGMALRRWMKKAGIEDNYFITNAVCCFPGRDENRRIKPPSVKHIKACRNRLLQTIEVMNPSVVVNVGEIALKAVMGKGMIKEARGLRQKRIIKRQKKGSRLLYFKSLTVYHPSYIIRQRGKRGNDLMKIAVEDLRRALQYARGIADE